MRLCASRIGAAIALLASALMLAGCGFSPLYATGGTKPAVAREMARIDVAPQGDRIGFDVRNRLIELLSPHIADQVAYTLTLDIEERSEGLAVEQDTSVTRFTFELIGRFVLQDRATGAVLTRGRSRSTSAYNVVDSQFATEIAERDVRGRTARALGEDIHKQLAIFFDRGGASATP